MATAGAVRKQKQAAIPSTPAARFEHLAEARMNKLLKDIRVLGNLGSRAYSPKAEMVAQMHAELMREIDRAFARISGRNLGVGFRFKHDGDH